MLRTDSPYSLFSLKEFFFVFCVFYSSGAISFYQSPLGYGTLIFLSVFTLIRYGISINNKLIIAFFIWAFYCTILLLKYGEFDLTFNHFVRISTLIIASYSLVKLFGVTLFYKFERIVTLLAAISLFFWIWFNISPSSLLSFGNIFHIGSSANSAGRQSEFYYLIIYTVEFFYNENTLIQRNYGFCIEPVAFSCFLVFALFFNVMRNSGFKFKKNIRFWILMVALLTTQSTTGIITFFVFLIFSYLLNKRSTIYKYVFFIPIILIFLFLFFKLEFLFPKIYEMYNDVLNFDDMLYRSSEKARFSAGRFGGLIIGWNDFITYPILGIGPNSFRSYAYLSNAALYNTNGFAGLMSTFGLFGLSIYSLLTIKTSIWISKFFNYRFKYGFFIIFTLCLMGAGIYRTVIFFSLMIFSYFITNENSFKNLEIDKNNVS